MDEPLTIDQWRAKRTGLKAASVSFLAVLVMTAIALCWFFGIRSRQDFLAYQIMEDEEFHPIWRDLAWRRVRRGDDLAETIRRYLPAGREGFGPYVILTYDCKYGSFNTVRVVAANGRLIYADTVNCFPWHVFFDSPDDMPAFDKAYARYNSQQLLEAKAYQIHRAIAAGQDVFVSKLIERSEILGDDLPYTPEMIRQYEELYGPDFAELLGLATVKLTVEVSKVLFGDLEPGARLTLSIENCSDDDLAGPELVFLRVDDLRMVIPGRKGGEWCVLVPKEALDWYQSLTADELKDFEARCLVRMAR